MQSLTETPLLDDGSRSKEFAIPPPVLEDREKSLLGPRQFAKSASFRQCDRKRFVHDHMFSCAQRGSCKGRMRFVRTSDDHQVHISMSSRFLGIGHNLHSRQIFPHLLGVARADHAQFETGNGPDQGSVKRFADEAKAD